MPHEEQNPPYISVVVAARNDNHGGNMLGRMQAFADSWIEQAKRYHLPSEIVVVEWNPPAERPRLKDDLRWPSDLGPCSVRFIEVPSEVHAAIPNSVGIPLHQMIAKNVGVRRARGEYIMASNLDIIFSAELMQFLASRRLERRAMYRMDRYDIASEIPATSDIDELLRFCEANMLRVFAREGNWDLNGDRTRAVEHGDIVTADSGIRLGDGWHGLESYDGGALRFVEPEAQVFFRRPAGAEPRMIFDVEAGPSAKNGWVEVEVLDHTRTRVASAIVNSRCQLQLTMPHALQSGHFTMGIRNGGMPLVVETRMLDLRVFRISWRGGVPRPGQAAAQETETAAAQEFHFKLGSDQRLGAIDVLLSDGAGHELYLCADSSELEAFPEGADCRVFVQMGLRSKGESGSDGADKAPARRGWRLDVISRAPGIDWAERHLVSPYAAHLRNPAFLHTCACGDFTMLAREHWFALRAYPEFPIWPMHVDSLMCYSAHHAGIREVVLRDPMRIFHIQHFSGAGWTPEGEQELYARVARKKVDALVYKDVVQCVDHMRRFDAPIIFSRSNWGLADYDLPETVV
jgi:hypothetical protein